jgi:hypothetical protein
MTEDQYAKFIADEYADMALNYRRRSVNQD